MPVAVPLGQVPQAQSRCLAFFVVRTKENILLQRRYSLPVDKNTGVRSDQTVILTAIDSAEAYPDALRRVSYYDADTGEDPDLDCRVGLCPGGDHPQATGAGCESLPNSTDSEHHAF